MIFKLISSLVVLLAFIYYVMLFAQIMSNGNFKFTNRKFTFGRCITPFYYWIASTNEPPKPKKEDPEDIKRLKEKIQNETKNED